MSEFQYYEFYSVDRELTHEEREEVDQLSSRFSPTSRRAIFTYSYSDFRHNEESILIKYFDFFIYLANWGTKRIMYKFPQELVSLNDVKQYTCDFENGFSDNGIKVYKKSKFIIIEFNFSEEGGDGYWISDEYHLSSELIKIRQDILNGDYRSLFIMWLHIKSLEFEYEIIDETFKIPLDLIPENLQTNNSQLESLITFYEIDEDWISGAANYSNQSKSKKQNYLKTIKDLPLEKKDDYLIRIIDGELNLNIKLKRELDIIERGKVKKETRKGAVNFGELLKSKDNAEAKRIKIEKKKVEDKRIKDLKEIERNKKRILEEIEFHFQKGSGKSYDEALVNILKLRTLAIHKDEENEFEKWIKKIKKKVATKPAMFKRIEKEGL